MKNMTLREIAAACKGTYYGDELSASKEVSSVVIDSRKVEEDCLFIAIRGMRADGHTFIPQVMEKGALCSLSEVNLGDVSYPYIRVSSCTQALKDLAEHYRRSLNIKVVGISGSVGKTSTKEMVASILSQKYCVLKTEGNFNNEIGLPLTVFRIRGEHQVAVLEMGISEFGEMSRLAKIARPDICVLTNIGVAHLENLGSRDGILKAKTEMFRYMNPEGTIILNGDDDKLIAYTPENHISPIYFGLDTAHPFHARHIENHGLKGTEADFVTPHRTFHAHIHVPGSHMVYNALAGTAVGYALGMTDEEILRGIQTNVTIAGRNHVIETENFTIIDDCYNANPASVNASIDVLSSADTRTVAIIGDMFELGKDSANMHYEVGAHAAASGINILICIGELTTDTVTGARDAAEKGGHPIVVHYFHTKKQFLSEIQQLLEKGDTILVKASHGMGFAEVVDKLKE